MENNLLKVEVNEEKGTIEVLDKRGGKLWKGDTIASLTYWEEEESNPITINVKKDRGWRVSSKIEEDKIELTFSNLKLGLSFSFKVELDDDKLKVTIPKLSIQEIKSYKFKEIKLLPQFGAAIQGEEGYLVLPQQSGVICKFKDKLQAEYQIGIYYKSYRECNMPIFGLKNKDSAFLGIINGGKYDATLHLGTNQGREHLYYIYPRFSLRYYYDEERLPEDLSIEYHFLTGKETTYVGMAKRYRSYVLSQGKVKPLKKRIKDNPLLNYAAHSLEVRIRCGWKPVPPLVLEQTPENEPEMKVACTFKRIGEIVDEFKKQGIDKVEFCLVGWNCKGHDGRYPQVFPVEERLEGEEKLKELIMKAQNMGYQIVGHDNYYDAYRISEDWDEEYIVKNHDGSLHKGGKWSGGQSYLLCPRRAYELFATRNLPRIRKLGFRGLHYTDVLSIVGPVACYNPQHPLKRREYAQWRNKILKLAQKTFGGVHSEGPLDFTADSLDRILYIEEKEEDLQKKDYVDEIIPLYEIVYHGILLYSLSHDTVNSLKGEKRYLKNIEYGALPLIYFYGHFLSIPSRDWLGKRDFRYQNKETLKKDVAKIKEVYEELIEKLGYLQTEFIEDHQKLAEDVYKTTYSNKKEVIVNYSDKVYNYKGIRIEPRSYSVI